MRLTTKTILIYLLISLPLLVVAALYSYSLINEEVKDGTDEVLYREKLSMQSLIRSLNQARSLYLRPDSLTGITLLKQKQNTYRFSDTVIFDKLEEENLTYRVYRSYFFYNGNHYLISVCKPALEEEELKESLLNSFLLIFVLLIIAFLAVNLALSRTLWKTFYKTIEQLNKYDVTSHEEIRFDRSSVKEFRQLNETLNRMTAKIHDDYQQQKEFTENASHELQTPLAVIKSKLDLLIQSKQLGSEEHELLQGLEQAVQKITSLNKALLLLTKIENNQFKEQKEVDLLQTTQAALETYSEIYHNKNIKTEAKFSGECLVQMNPLLAELLVNNLVKNAFRHNYEGGQITIELDKTHLQVSNTGKALQIGHAELYDRFKKDDASKESLGLGLSIVKSIVNVCGFTIQYEYINELHVFTVHFR